MATNFLEATGGSTAGYFSATVTLMSTELVSLGSSLTAISASTFTSSGNFGQAIWGDVWVQFGGSFTGSAGSNIAGWFLRSPDGGTTFETQLSSAAPMPRPPDFLIPISTKAYASTNICYGSGLVKMPWAPFKVYIQNAGSSNTLPSSATAYTTINLGPVAVQY